MFMVMAANFQVEGRDDIPACVLKMQTSIKQLDLIMSMINQLPHAASAGSVSAKVAVSMYPLRCMASSRHLSRPPRLEVNSGDPVSTSGWAVLNAARLALLISLRLWRARGISTAWRSRISRATAVSFRWSMGMLNGRRGRASMIFLVLSYDILYKLAAPRKAFFLPAFVVRILTLRSRKSGYGLLLGCRSGLDAGR